jgi:hypothetical protein
MFLCLCFSVLITHASWTLIPYVRKRIEVVEQSHLSVEISLSHEMIPFEHNFLTT